MRGSVGHREGMIPPRSKKKKKKKKMAFAFALGPFYSPSAASRPDQQLAESASRGHYPHPPLKSFPTAPCVAGRRWCHHLRTSKCHHECASSGDREDDSSVLHRYGIPPLLRHVQHKGAGVAQLVVGACPVEKEAALKGSPLAT